MGWVQALALTLAVIVCFGSAVGGGLVWDDEDVIGAAAAAAGPLDALRTNLFASPSGEGPQYYRPLVTLSYWVEVNLFDAAPNFGMHVSNLAWHAAASALLLAAMRRRVVGPKVRASAALSATCFGAVLVWALMPLKAENVAWITGRGDVMGTVFLLAGIELGGRSARPWARTALVGIGTALAVLCKEPMVAAPAVVAGFAMCEVRLEKPDASLREHVRMAGQRGEVVVSFLVVVAYLLARRWVMPISTGDSSLFAAFTLLDRVGLFFETTGVAVAAVLAPWRAQILRASIGFHPDGTLRHDIPHLLALGVAAWSAAALVAWKKPAARGPLLVGLGGFLPVSNLVPIVLEARLSDRFLYLPTLGVAVGIAAVVSLLHGEQRLRFAAGTTIAIGCLLGLSCHARAALFTSSDALFSAEIRRGNRALAVYSNAAFAAARAFRYREARDHQIKLAQRYEELGFPGSSFSAIFAATKAQVWATEETHPPSVRSFERLCRDLLADRREQLPIELEGGFVVEIQTGNAATRRHVAKYGVEVRSSLARVLARRGDPEGMAIAEKNVAQCPRCSEVLVHTSEVALAAARTDDAIAWLEAAAPTPLRETFLSAARAQNEVLARGEPHARAIALFIGGAFGPACRAGAASTNLAEASEAVRSAIAAACWLAPDRSVAAQMVGQDLRQLERLAAAAEPLRYDITARVETVSRALPQEAR